MAGFSCWLPTVAYARGRDENIMEALGGFGILPAYGEPVTPHTGAGAAVPVNDVCCGDCWGREDSRHAAGARIPGTDAGRSLPRLRRRSRSGFGPRVGVCAKFHRAGSAFRSATATDSLERGWPRLRASLAMPRTQGPQSIGDWRSPLQVQRQCWWPRETTRSKPRSLAHRSASPRIAGPEPIAGSVVERSRLDWWLSF